MTAAWTDDPWLDGYRSGQELLLREPAAQHASADVAQRRLDFWRGRLDALTHKTATQSDCGTCAVSARMCTDLVAQGGSRCCGFCTHRPAPNPTCGDQVIDANGAVWVSCELPKGHHRHRDGNQTWIKPGQVPTCAACEAENAPKEHS